MTEMDPPPPTTPEPASSEPAPPASPPPSPPAWQAPPTSQPAWQPATPAAASRPARPGTVTAASIVLMVIGTLVVLIGLLFIIGGAFIGSVGNRPDLGIDLNGLSGAVGGIVAVVGVIVVLFGALELLSGIFAMLGRAWARILALVISVLGGLIALLGLVGSRSTAGGSPIISLVLLVAYVFVIWAMASAGRYFAER